MAGPLRTGPCTECELNSWALMRFGSRIESLRAGARPRGALRLPAEDLAAAVGGRSRRRLELELLEFTPGATAARAGESDALVACRHQGDFQWPQLLAGDPEEPWVLHLKGEPDLLNRCDDGRGVAIVGARKADAYGRSAARSLAAAVSGSGGVVVSGLAFGVDAAAHEGALSARSGSTLAVVGGGIDTVYPPANAGLQRMIEEKGAVISEMPFGCGVWKWSFPARNRLIAALSAVTAVVQGARGSGSLHTAEAALVRSRAVAAVPGRMGERLSEGSNSLIADGAIPILRPEDLVKAAGLDARPRLQIPERLAAAASAIAAGNLPELGAQIGAIDLAAALGELELMGLAERDGTGGWRLVGSSG